jgi:hypothetical protein
MVGMRKAFSLGVLICVAVPAWGDFKYTESSKLTGGAMAGMVKFAGVFSKGARQATQPTENTTYVKGNRMRKDEAEGRREIIDLDGRRMIFIDTQKRTYSITTFDQMMAGIERAREQVHSQETPQPQTAQPANVKVTPKVDVTRTGKTATILNLPASEVQMRIDMEMQSTDPRTQGQSGTMWVKSDCWVTPTIPGYEELAAFYQKMGKEMAGMAGALFGSNPQASQGMAELRKNAGEFKGFPLLQYVSMGMEVTGQTSAQAAQTPETQPAAAQSQNSQVASPRDALAQSLGGVFGGFGRKKKQQQDQSSQDSSTGGAAPDQPPAPPAAPGSFMEMTTRVTTYSSDALDEALFAIPEGYAEVPAVQPYPRDQTDHPSTR